ncbi:UBX domain-containing protein [Meyerozyma sp. JA9]|nr:UBX domain-containing protein [Meyerozyma sp. JA9]
MVVSVLLCRVVAAFINVIYFRDEYAATAANPSDPIDNANKFIRELEYNLQPSEPMHTLPPFFQGSYTQALFMATNRAKFLFVYLAHPRSENSSGMFENIITAPEFTSIFNDPDFVIWGGDLTSSESYQLANSLNVTRFPFLGLMCLTRSTTMMPSGPVKSTPKISLVSKVQGRVKDRAKAQAIINTKFKNRINKYEADLREIRHELMNKFMSQVLVKQQDISYQNSLARDRAKKLQREREGLLSAYLQSKVAHLLQLQKSQSPDTARVALRFSDGNRVTLTLPSTTRVPEIYEFVEIHRRGYTDASQSQNTPNSQNPQNTQSASTLEVVPDDFKFSLISSVPPRSSLKDFWGGSVRDVDFIYPNGMLIVEDI